MNEAEKHCKATQYLGCTDTSDPEYILYCDLEINHTAKAHFDNEANTHWFEGTVDNATTKA